MTIQYAGTSQNGRHCFTINEVEEGKTQIPRTWIIGKEELGNLNTHPYIRPNVYNDVALFYIPEFNRWICFDFIEQIDKESGNIIKSTVSDPPYIWKTDYVPQEGVGHIENGVHVVISPNVAKVVCPKCGKPAQCYWRNAAAAVDGFEDCFMLGCNECGHQSQVYLSGGNTNSSEWHNLCPFCMKSSSGHHGPDPQKTCSNCGSVNFFTCTYIGDTGPGSEIVDTYSHTCRSCGTKISEPCRTVSQAGEQDQDNFCPSCGHITQAFS